MIDFHSHILPEVDDGASSISESLAMLRESFLQGVDLVVSTSHFYPDQEYPGDFLRRRNEAFRELQDAILLSAEVYPQVRLGAEVLYFPGIAEAEEISPMIVEGSCCILIEPPMSAWADAMLDEIVQLGRNFHCKPAIAHVDRYMQYLQDTSLMERVRERDLIVQVNAEYFLDDNTVKAAIKNLKKGNIQLIGSDCHNITTRPPRLGLAKKQARLWGAERDFEQLHHNAANLLQGRGNME